MPERGKFIVLEGGEGAGKSTCAAIISKHIEASGQQVLLTREPGGCELAEGVRELLMREWTPDMPAISELLLMFAARAAHLEQRILPALEQGIWVLCDRFTDASYVYQGVARRVGRDKVAVLEQLVQGEMRPDLVLLLDVPVDIGLSRVAVRNDDNRFDRESVEFHDQVRAAYLEQASINPHRYAVVDASQPLKDVENSLLMSLKSLINGE